MTATTFPLNGHTLSLELEPHGLESVLTVTSSNNGTEFMQELLSEMEEWETVIQRQYPWEITLTLENNQILCWIHAPVARVEPLVGELKEYLEAELELPATAGR